MFRWPISVAALVQGTAAAMLAWLVSQQLPHDHEPFFAPIAAFVALNAPMGERGTNAVRLVLGVMLGIVSGELTTALVPEGYTIRMGSAILLASVIAVWFGGSRIVVAQAASAAILTVAVAADPGVTRLLDALVGAGVGLLFTQILFPPDPVRLIRDAERAYLQDLVGGMDVVAEGLNSGDSADVDAAVNQLRDRRTRLAELARVRGLGIEVAQRSPRRLGRRHSVARESKIAGHLDLLAGSCLMLARSAAVIGDQADRRRLAPYVAELVSTLSELTEDLGDPDVAQHAVNRALRLTGRLTDAGPSQDLRVGQAVLMLRVAAADLMALAGVEPRAALTAAQQGAEALPISPPPRVPPLVRPRFGLGRWWGAPRSGQRPLGNAD